MPAEVVREHGPGTRLQFRNPRKVILETGFLIFRRYAVPYATRERKKFLLEDGARYLDMSYLDPSQRDEAMCPHTSLFEVHVLSSGASVSVRGKVCHPSNEAWNVIVTDVLRIPNG